MAVVRCVEVGGDEDVVVGRVMAAREGGLFVDWTTCCECEGGVSSPS